MFSSNGAFKTTELLHVKIHPIVTLFILIVKYCACLHVVYLVLMTTPYHGMDLPAPQLLWRQEQMLPQHCLISEWSVAAMELADGCKNTNLLGSYIKPSIQTCYGLSFTLSYP